MEYNYFLQNCNENDVLELNNQILKLSTFSSDSSLAFSYDYSSDALTAIANKCVKSSNSLSRKNVQQLFNGEGIDASILRIGSQGWKKGKLKFKVVLEFCPDEPEIEELPQTNDARINCGSSPLDDIRQMMNDKK